MAWLSPSGLLPLPWYQRAPQCPEGVSRYIRNRSSCLCYHYQAHQDSHLFKLVPGPFLLPFCVCVYTQTLSLGWRRSSDPKEGMRPFFSWNKTKPWTVWLSQFSPVADSHPSPAAAWRVRSLEYSRALWQGSQAFVDLILCPLDFGTCVFDRIKPWAPLKSQSSWRPREGLVIAVCSGCHKPWMTVGVSCGSCLRETQWRTDRLQLSSDSGWPCPPRKQNSNLEECDGSCEFPCGLKSPLCLLSSFFI